MAIDSLQATVARTQVLIRVGLPLVAAALAGACAGPQSILDPAGPAAEAIARLWWIMFAGALAVLALVMGLLAVALRGRRERPLRRPDRFIALGGLALPTVTLFALLVYGVLASARITGIHEPVERVVEVTGRQWFWEFRHLDGDGATLARSIDHLTLPLGQMVEFRVTSADVIHSFWIPRLGGKIDAIPGRVNTLRLRADRAGPMLGHCAEFCGLEHAHMGFEVRVLEPAAFERWLEQPAAAGEAGEAGEGGS